MDVEYVAISDCLEFTIFILPYYQSEIAHLQILKFLHFPTFTTWQKPKPYFSVRVAELNPLNGWADVLRAESGTLLWKK